MPMALNLATWSSLALLVLTGCSEPRQLYMGSHTAIGINAAVNPEQNTGRVMIGYDRVFAAIVPRSAPGTNAGEREAMSALVCSELGVEGVTIRRFTEAMATGRAATEFAARLRKEHDSQVRDLFECFRNERGGGS